MHYFQVAFQAFCHFIFEFSLLQPISFKIPFFLLFHSLFNIYSFNIITNVSRLNLIKFPVDNNWGKCMDRWITIWTGPIYGINVWDEFWEQILCNARFGKYHRNPNKKLDTKRLECYKICWFPVVYESSCFAVLMFGRKEKGHKTI